MPIRLREILATCATLLIFTQEGAAATASQRCAAAQNGAVGKYASCVQKAAQKFVARGSMDTGDRDLAFAECADTLRNGFSDAEAEGSCASEGQSESVESFLRSCLSAAQAALAGNPLSQDVDTCNANHADCLAEVESCEDETEQCSVDLTTCEGSLDLCNNAIPQFQQMLQECQDWTAAGGLAGCQSQVVSCESNVSVCVADLADCFDACTAEAVLAATGQTNSYGDGDDGDLQLGAGFHLVDNADGTMSDPASRLMWEKKFSVSASSRNCASEAGSCADPHDPNNKYSWTSSGTAFDGSLVTVFLEQLNDRCSSDATVVCASNSDCSEVGGPCGFAGYRDWRVPNQRELTTILDFTTTRLLPRAFIRGCFYPPCSDLTDPACACNQISWTSTTNAAAATQAWRADSTPPKTSYQPAMAVRGG
jgi:hypothetical protein